MSKPKQARKKKYNPRRFGLTKILPHEVNLLLDPLERFIKEAEEDNCYVDTNDDLLMGYQGETPEEAARKGKQVYRAYDNLYTFAETVFQIASLHENEDLFFHIADMITEFKEDFINRLREEKIITTSGIRLAKKLCTEYRVLLAQSDRDLVWLVARQITRAIDKAQKKGIRYITDEELRAWLLEHFDVKGRLARLNGETEDGSTQAA